MAAPPQVNVYASLPLTVVLDGNLDVDPTNWRWVHCLSIPLETLTTLRFSHRPYRWIRYAIGVVVGAQGSLSKSPDLFNAWDDSAVPEAESANLYYHVSDEEKRRMFPIDPRGRTHTTSSVLTPRRSSLRDNVAARDGRQCVLVGARGDEVFCRAAHLLPHGKGDDYISTYTHARSRDPAKADIIEEIDDTRNGLFLVMPGHTCLGKYLAFLLTPNFAMDTSDVEPNAPPTEKRYTAHFFKDFHFFNGVSGSSIQLPDSRESPPAILFDAVYAAAVLYHFGTATLKNHIAATWKDVYDKEFVDGRKLAAQSNEKREQERHDSRLVPDAFDMLLALPHILVPPNELQTTLREAEEKAEAEVQRRSKEKVSTWIKQVSDESLAGNGL